MTLANGRGLLFLLPKVKLFSEAISAKISALAAIYGTYYDWKAIQAVPTTIRFCDPPDQLIQPTSPALVFSFLNKTTVTPEILYNYQIDISYVYASPVERKWGDDALYACGLAAEAIYEASKENRPAGIVAINAAADYDISYFQEGGGTTPLLARILTISTEWQVEEDY